MAGTWIVVWKNFEFKEKTGYIFTCSACSTTYYIKADSIPAVCPICKTEVGSPETGN